MMFVSLLYNYILALEAEEREEYLRTKLGRRRTWAEWKEEEREWKLLE